MKKKILAFMLTLVTVIAMIPVTAFASGPSSVSGATPYFVTINVGDVQNIVVEINAPAEGNAYSCRQLNTPEFVEVSGDTYFSNGQSSVTIPVKGTSIGTETLAFKLYKNGSVVEGGSTVFVEVTVAPVQYTVAFDTGGGTPASIPSQTVEEDGKVTKPEDPTKAGCEFAGWIDESTGNPWDFELDTVESDTTLVALWDEVIEPVEFTVELDQDEFTYDGKGHVPTITVKGKDGNVLEAGTDYYVSIAGGENAKQINAGEVEVIVYSENKYYKDTTVTYTIKPAQLKISLDKTEFTYNGEDQIPNVTVTGVEGETLTKDDYQVTFGQAKRIDAGTYTVKAASFNSNYVASEAAEFKIVEAAKVPDTGDADNAWLYVLAGVLALGAMGTVVLRKKADR